MKMCKAVTIFKKQFIIIWDRFYWEKYKIVAQSIFCNMFCNKKHIFIIKTLYPMGIRDRLHCRHWQTTVFRQMEKREHTENSLWRQTCMTRWQVKDGCKVLHLTYYKNDSPNNKEWVWTFVDCLLDARDIISSFNPHYTHNIRKKWMWCNETDMMSLRLNEMCKWGVAWIWS